MNRRRRPAGRAGWKKAGVANSIEISGANVPIKVKRPTLSIEKERGANIEVRDVPGGYKGIIVKDERGRHGRRGGMPEMPMMDFNVIRAELQQTITTSREPFEDLRKGIKKLEALRDKARGRKRRDLERRLEANREYVTGNAPAKTNVGRAVQQLLAMEAQVNALEQVYRQMEQGYARGRYTPEQFRVAVNHFYGQVKAFNSEVAKRSDRIRVTVSKATGDYGKKFSHGAKGRIIRRKAKKIF
ncbi:MAG: hypothetical protein CL943_03475 [Candidatus Diapherotrites archaeon]|uniref:Uncharacterized protein n=1 Tax=Candidatus Iainarchaeum sp. TaxID=3101447 RepID=A0A2D6M1N7_9ARCH|nr:hypothetical protein [Candidatus Diapherotrites archaeon]|tara:strand:- start:830 stop:1558 length:729 start_codon:yes stop_codon:yes gene_type:complete